MIGIADGSAYQCRNEGVVDKPVAVRTAIVPWTDEIGTLLVVTVIQRFQVLTHGFQNGV